MTEQLDGTVALVTGASSGIGAATAKGLAEAGAAVAAVARRLDRLEALVAEIEAAGGQALAVQADVADAAQATAAVERAVAELGRLDTVVNNAGVMLLGPVAEAPDGEWDRMIDVNLRGLLQVSRAALPHLVRAAADSPRRVADLVNISSTAGRASRPGSAVYSLTKFGMGAFTEALRQEVLGQRVRISVVEPGNVDTELRSHVRDGVREGLERRSAGIERLRPEDIADAVTYIVTRPRRVAVNQLLVRAGEQTW